MNNKINYIETNRQMWNLTAEIFKQNSLQQTIENVRIPDFSTFDETEKFIFDTLIDVTGKRVVQIGCNVGSEIICLKKMGAGNCVGIDISEKFIEQAKQLARASNQDVDFVCSNIYNIKEELYGAFDLVYITIGVLGWMPDIEAFFEILSKLLTKDGQLFMYEQHPFLGMFNPLPPHKMDASYFQKEPFEDDILPEYIDRKGIAKATSYWFPHTIASILGACIKYKLVLSHFNEYSKDISYTFKEMESNDVQLPMSFTLIAQKK